MMMLLCMVCGKEAFDGYEYTESDGVVDRGGPHWVYCRPCDCWTEHPEPVPAGDAAPPQASPP